MKQLGALVLALGMMGGGMSAAHPPSHPPIHPPSHPAAQLPIPPGHLFVCVQDDAKVAVVDMATRTVVNTIDLQKLGFPATAKPHFIVVEPDRRHWYVSLIGANTVVKFNAANEVVGRFTMETPGMLALSGANQLVVTRSMSAVNPPKRVAVLDRTTMEGEEVDIVFPRPHPMAVAGTFAYTGSLGTNQIASVNLTNDRVTLVTVPGSTHAFVQFAVSPDGRTLVGSTEVSGQLLVFDLTAPATPALKASVPLGKMAFDPTFTPDGRFVWVPVKMENAVAVIDTATWKETRRITSPSFQQPHQIVFSTDGRFAFISNNNKMDHMADPAHAGHAMPGGDGPASLSVIDVASGATAQSLVLGKNLTGMGVAR
jgi:DNA-binding beta-propeller fold protein YncE